MNEENAGNLYEIISDCQTDLREYGVAALHLSFNEVENFRCMFKKKKDYLTKATVSRQMILGVTILSPPPPYNSPQLV